MCYYESEIKKGEINKQKVGREVFGTVSTFQFSLTNYNINVQKLKKNTLKYMQLIITTFAEKRILNFTKKDFIFNTYFNVKKWKMSKTTYKGRKQRHNPH